MNKIITILILVIAIIHLLPLVGAISNSRVEALYDIKIEDKNLEILMRHRAILFGILGGFLTYAAFTPKIQPLAFVAASLSLTSFFVLSASVGQFNNAIFKIIIADIIATISLIAAITLFYFNKKNFLTN